MRVMVAILLLLVPVAKGQKWPAFEFDGTNDIVNIPDSASLAFGDGSTDTPFTVAAWAFMDDATQFRLCSKYSGANPEWYFMLSGGDDLNFALYDSAAYESVLTDTALTSYEGQWVHLAGTYDGRGGSTASDGLTLYVNASPVAATKFDSGTYVAMEDRNIDLTIGFYPSTYADGKVDDFRLYNRALTAEEIAVLAGMHDGSLTNTVPRPSDPTYGDVYVDMDTVRDLSGNGHHGGVTNTVSYAQDGSGPYRIFNPSGNWIEVEHDSILNGMPLSVSAWVYVDGEQSLYASVVDKYSTGSGNGWQIFMDAAEKLHAWYFTTSGDIYGGGQGTLLTSVSLNDTNWHHVVVVVDTNSGRIYLDGQLDDTEGWTGSPASSTTSHRMAFGVHDFGGGTYWNGSLGPVGIYTNALTTNEIVSLNAAGRSVLPSVTVSGPVAEYDMTGQEQGGSLVLAPYPRVIPGNTISTVQDGSTYGNSGTASGGVQAAVGIASAGPGGANFDGGTFTESDLVSWWRPGITGDATDSFGSNDGASTGTTITVGTGFDFDGTNDLVRFESSIVPAYPYAIAFWAKAKTAASGTVKVIANTSGVDSTKYGFHILWYTGGGFYFTGVRGGGGNNWSISTAALDDLEWHHVVCQWDGTTDADKAEIYVDGVQDTTGTAASVPTNAPSFDLALSVDADGEQYYWDGYLSEFAVYTNALDAHTIREIYEHGKHRHWNQ